MKQDVDVWFLRTGIIGSCACGFHLETLQGVVNAFFSQCRQTVTQVLTSKKIYFNWINAVFRGFDITFFTSKQRIQRPSKVTQISFDVFEREKVAKTEHHAKNPSSIYFVFSQLANWDIPSFIEKWCERIIIYNGCRCITQTTKSKLFDDTTK